MKRITGREVPVKGLVVMTDFQCSSLIEQIEEISFDLENEIASVANLYVRLRRVKRDLLAIQNGGRA